MSTRLCIVLCPAVLWLGAARGLETERDPAASASSGTMTEREAIELVRGFCVDCHQGDEPEANLNLETFASMADVGNSIEHWTRIANRISDGTMPPPGSDAPSPDARMALTRWIREAIHAAVCDDGVSPGGPMLRRLNRTEYANTVRDLLRIHVDAGHALPSDGAGGEGFDNAAETLFISPIHAEKYLDAAREALEHALKDPDARRRLLVAQPTQ